MFQQRSSACRCIYLKLLCWKNYVDSNERLEASPQQTLVLINIKAHENHTFLILKKKHTSQNKIIRFRILSLLNNSFCRAMNHLSRLKLLVEEPRQKSREDGEKDEKDEDEGRFSSSSADGLVCSQQNA